jgi:Flp pilus assembly protein TadG
MSRTLRRTWRDRRAGASVEFAIAASFLTLLMVGTYDFATLGRRAIEVGNAARAGAAHAQRFGWNTTNVQAAVTSAIGNAAITASPAPAQFCGCPTASGVTETLCTAACPDGQSSGTYVRVSARATHTFLITYPGRGASQTLSATTVARVLP